MIIWKHALPIKDLHSPYMEIAVPEGYKILSAVNQRERLVVYTSVPEDVLRVRVDPAKGVCPKMLRVNIPILVTGENFPYGVGDFLTTVLFDEGRYVLHVFLPKETS